MQRIVLIILFAIGSSVAVMAIPSAPEIDAASGGSALALLAGSVLMFRGRRKQ